MTRAERAAVNKQIAIDKKKARKRAAVAKARRVLRENKAREAGLAGAVGDVTDVLVKDAKNLAVGTFTEGVNTVKHASHLLTPLGTSKDKKAALKYFGTLPVNIARGVEDIIPNPKSLPYGDVSLVQWDGSWKPEFWVRGGETDDSARAAKAWKERPLTSALTASMVVAPAAQLGSVSRIAAAIRKTDPAISKATALRMARREARNPGWLGAQYGPEMGKAGVQPRVLRSEVDGKLLNEVEVPQSRSAVGRGAQTIADAISRQIPAGRVFSERKRANRAIQRKLDQEQRREQAKLNTLMKPVRQAGYSRTGRPSKPEQALMTYTLQTPRDVLPAEAALAVKTDLDGILKAGGWETEGKFRGLSPFERKMVEEQVAGLERVLEKPPNGKVLNDAVAALETLAQATENLGLYIATNKARGVSPELADAIREGFAARKNLLAQRLDMEGDARGFFPHRSVAESTVGEFSGGTRLPAVGSVVGVPRAPSLGGPNALVRYRTGTISTDPAALLTTYLQRFKFFWNEETRRDLYNEGFDLDTVRSMKRGKGMYIRNPDAPPARIPTEAKLALDPDNARAVVDDALDWQERVDGDFFGALHDWQKDAFVPDSMELPAEWLRDIDNVRWLPRDVVETRIKHVFMQKPNGVLAPTISTLNALTRLATIQGKPLRYALSNTAQNLIMVALTNPSALPAAVGNQAGLLRAIPKVDRVWDALRLPQTLKERRPDLYQLAVTETGDVAATAGLPDFYVGPQTKAQTVERGVTKAQRALGTALGTVADTPYRLAVWQKHAKRHGFTTDADLERLLTSDDPAVVRVREQIRQRTRDDMLDFDRLTPFERENISRFFFIWPFVRAGLRYPITYARDYPVRAGLAAAATSQQDYVGDTPTSVRDLFKVQTPGGGEFDAGFLSPVGPALEQASGVQQAIAGLAGFARGEPLDMSAVSDMLAPWVQDTGGAVFGRGPTLDDLARSTVPGYAGVTDVIREGTAGIPAVSRFTPKTGDKRLARSVRKRKDADKQKLGAAWQAASATGAALPPADEAKASFDAWWMWQEYQRRAMWGAREAGRTKLTDKEKGLLLNRVAREFFPSLKVADDERLSGEPDGSPKHGQYVEWMYDQMFAARRQVLAADDR